MAFTYLFVPCSVSGQESDLAMEALRLEREIYAAPSVDAANRAIMAKVEVRKAQRLYAEAATEMMRVYTYALDDELLGEYYYQRALCSYLAADFEASLAATSEARLYLTDTTALTRMYLVEALAAGEVGDWERSRQAAIGYWADASDEQRAALDSLYDTAPKVLNPMVAWWLGLIPGVGHFYAGEVGSGLLSLAVNGAFVAFGVGEIGATHYLSAWLGAGGVLSTTYMLGQERARMFAERRNERVLRRFNDSLREILLAETLSPSVLEMLN